MHQLKRLFCIIIGISFLGMPLQAADQTGSILDMVAGAALENVTILKNVVIDVPANPHGGAVELLATVVVHDKAKEKPLPTILTATAYRHEFVNMMSSMLANFEYNIVVVDVRGSGSSGGVWQLLDLAEQHDLAYIIDHWIPKQPWSDKQVGMFGGSYMAITQLQAAGLIERDSDGNPKHLKAIFPMAQVADTYKDMIGQGGNVHVSFTAVWLVMTDVLAMLPPSDLQGGRESAQQIWQDHIEHTPDVFGNIFNPELQYDGPWFDQKSPMIYWPVKPAGGWGFPEGDKAIPASLPAFTMGSWFDIFTVGTINNYVYGLSRHSNADKVLIMGEGYHIDAAGMGMGIPSILSGELPARWFDWKIKGKGEPFMVEYPVILYVMGENKWRAERDWPVSRAIDKKLYLSKNTPSPIDGDLFTDPSNPQGNIICGLIDVAPLALASENDNPVMVHDPRRLHGKTSRSTVRWLGGMTTMLGGDEMAGEDEREDEIGIPTFTTEPLAEDLEIVGPATLTFWARTDFGLPAEIFNLLYDGSTGWMNELISGMFDVESNLFEEQMKERTVQWVAEINDVFPDGRARNVASGCLRASHRPYDDKDPHEVDSSYVPFDPFYNKPDITPSPINEGELYKYVLEFWPTCNIFKAGHRVRVSLTGSDFPHLIPVMTPSSSEIVIDVDHPAVLDFKTTDNSVGEGDNWLWLPDEGFSRGEQQFDSFNDYLLSHNDAKGGVVAAEGQLKASLLPDDSEESSCFISLIK